MATEIFLGEPPANIKQWIIDHATPVEPTAPNGKVLYKMSAEGEWLESNAEILNGELGGFDEKNSAVAVIFPSKDINENDVISIYEWSFADCYFNSVIIPNSITSIGSSAFSACFDLTNLTISDNVTSIGENAFYGCNIITVTIVATGKPGASAANVKQMIISAIDDTSISDNITWNMPS